MTNDDIWNHNLAYQSVLGADLGGEACALEVGDDRRRGSVGGHRDSVEVHVKAVSKRAARAVSGLLYRV